MESYSTWRIIWCLTSMLFFFCFLCLLLALCSVLCVAITEGWFWECKEVFLYTVHFFFWHVSKTEKWLLASSRSSVPVAPTGWIFVKYFIWGFFVVCWENSSSVKTILLKQWHAWFVFGMFPVMVLDRTVIFLIEFYHGFPLSFKTNGRVAFQIRLQPLPRLFCYIFTNQPASELLMTSLCKL